MKKIKISERTYDTVTIAASYSILTLGAIVAPACCTIAMDKYQRKALKNL